MDRHRGTGHIEPRQTIRIRTSKSLQHSMPPEAMQRESENINIQHRNRLQITHFSIT